MKLAIMQPYLFPYIGYFQLIQAADVFVLYDDVNFRKQSWLNRNRILLNGKEHLFTIPCKGISSYKRINEVQLDNDKKPFVKFKKLIEQAYRKAPNYINTKELIDKILDKNPTTISELGKNSIMEICEFLDIKTTILTSSEDFSDSAELHKEHRIIDICKKMEATEYINAQGGQELYSKSDFLKHQIELNFLIPNSNRAYNQINSSEFIPWLSIIDVLMHNEKDKVIELTNSFQLK